MRRRPPSGVDFGPIGLGRALPSKELFDEERVFRAALVAALRKSRRGRHPADWRQTLREPMLEVMRLYPRIKKKELARCLLEEDCGAGTPLKKAYISLPTIRNWLSEIERTRKSPINNSFPAVRIVVKSIIIVVKDRSARTMLSPAYSPDRWRLEKES